MHIVQKKKKKVPKFRTESTLKRDIEGKGDETKPSDAPSFTQLIIIQFYHPITFQ